MCELCEKGADLEQWATKQYGITNSTPSLKFKYEYGLIRDFGFDSHLPYIRTPLDDKFNHTSPNFQNHILMIEKQEIERLMADGL